MPEELFSLAAASRKATPDNLGRAAAHLHGLLPQPDGHPTQEEEGEEEKGKELILPNVFIEFSWLCRFSFVPLQIFLMSC